MSCDRTPDKTMNFIKNWLKQRREADALVNDILNFMNTEPEAWTVTEYHAIFGGLHIWIENSPNADMTINGRRLPRRGELRRALALLLMKQKVEKETKQ